MLPPLRVTAASPAQSETTEAPVLLKELANIFTENDVRPFAGCVFAFLAALVVCVFLVARGQQVGTSLTVGEIPEA